MDNTCIPRLPYWFKQRVPDGKVFKKISSLIHNLNLHTVCEEAHCPNIGRCFSEQTLTFMILGNICTRSCRFCAVTKGNPHSLDREEPGHLARAVKSLGLQYVVITSVTRDDLSDGGAGHFVAVVKEMHSLNPESTIELLIPDLQGDNESLKKGQVS